MSHLQLPITKNKIRYLVVGGLVLVTLIACIYFVPKTMLFNVWMARYQISNGDLEGAIDNLTFMVEEENDANLKIDNYHTAMNVFNAIGAGNQANSISIHMINRKTEVPRAYYFAGIYSWGNGDLYEAEHYLSNVKHLYNSAYSELLSAIAEENRLKELQRRELNMQIASLFIPSSLLDFIPVVKIFKNTKKAIKAIKIKKRN